mgnify:CR=1 FL=1
MAEELDPIRPLLVLMAHPVRRRDVHAVGNRVRTLCGPPCIELRAALLGGPASLVGDLDDDGFADLLTSNADGQVRAISTLAVGRPLVVITASPSGGYIWFGGGLATPAGITSNDPLFGGLQSPFIEGISNEGLSE